MFINVSRDAITTSKMAAEKVSFLLNETISKQGEASIVLSTGASQLYFFEALIKENINWQKITMFHLDEYIDLPEVHKASFRKYLRERFVDKIDLKEACFVNGEGDIEANIRYLNEEISNRTIDIGVIGIGENGHIAFNDPPADFNYDKPYQVVELDEKCRAQQVHEGWFSSIEEVPQKAISMSVQQIMKCKSIVSVVPYEAKALAIKNTLSNEISNLIPATILKTHSDWNLYLDKDSASLVFPV